MKRALLVLTLTVGILGAVSSAAAESKSVRAVHISRSGGSASALAIPAVFKPAIAGPGSIAAPKKFRKISISRSGGSVAANVIRVRRDS